MSLQAPSQEQLQGAVGIVLSKIHQNAFLHKMAQLGHVAETQEDVDELMQLGFKVAQLAPEYLQNLNKPAQAKPTTKSKYASVNVAMDQFLGLRPQSEADEIKEAAMQMAQDPEIYQAACVIKAAEAAQAQAETAA